MMYKDNFVAVIKNNGKILRETYGVVYLPFGSNYSILLKNKDFRRAVVNIEIDGEDVLGGRGLIVNGNSYQEIDSFMRTMDKSNKFRFINKTKEIQDYRGDRIDDGLVRISYRFEIPRQVFYTKTYYNNWNSSGSFWGSFDNVSCSSSIGGGTKCSSTPLVDEGITVRGEDVSRHYVNSYVDDLEQIAHVIVLQLKGLTDGKYIVSAPVTTRTKFRCSTCGRKSRSSNKYCNNCGTYLR